MADENSDHYEVSLQRWVADLFGATVVIWERVPGGASRLSFRVSISGGASYFVRADRGAGPLSGTRYDLQREHEIISGLHAAGLPVPAVYAWSPELNAILMEAVAGNSGPEGMQDVALQQGLLECIVALQRAPQGLKCFPECQAGVTVGEAVRAELEIWRDLYQTRVTLAEPLIAFALQWLDSKIPDESQAAVAVHGDLGPGNFMYENSTVLAVIDWELAHPGHPLEDLACIIARSLGSPFGDNRSHLDYFGKLSGKPVDRPALEYCLVLVLTRFCIGIQMALSKPSPTLDVPMLMLFRQVNLRALMGIIAGQYGISLPAPLSREASLTEVAGLYAYMGDTLQSLVAPQVAGDRFLASKVRGLSALNLYLSKLALYGCDSYASEEISVIGWLLGHVPEDLPTARSVLCEAIASATPPPAASVVGYLSWRNQREQYLMSEALGDMAQRVLEY